MRQVQSNLGCLMQVPFDEAAASGSDVAVGDGRPPLFMFIAVFSTTDFRHRRDAVRDSWMEDAKRHTNVLPKFILTGERHCDTQHPACN